MREGEQEFRSAEEVAAAAEAEFDGLDLNNRGAVGLAAQNLNDIARNGNHDYSRGDRLASLLDTYDKRRGNSQEQVKKAA